MNPITICYQDIATSAGGARLWFVALPGGFLLACGTSEARAKLLYEALVSRDHTFQEKLRTVI